MNDIAQLTWEYFSVSGKILQLTLINFYFSTYCIYYVESWCAGCFSYASSGSSRLDLCLGDFVGHWFPVNSTQLEPDLGRTFDHNYGVSWLMFEFLKSTISAPFSSWAFPVWVNTWVKKSRLPPTWNQSLRCPAQAKVALLRRRLRAVIPRRLQMLTLLRSISFNLCFHTSLYLA